MSNYAEIPQHIQDLIDARAEIERLHEDLDYTQTLMRYGAEQREKDKTEIERLHLENEALGAAMSSDGADACGALVVANAEIERLREMLRDGVAVMTEAERSWWRKRVREELGE